jgi:hypothetical protein
MAEFDASEFVDRDFQGRTAPEGAALRAPTREEVDSKVAEAHQKLAELRRVQEELERERNALEESRRRQAEFHTGREEMIHNLTRGLGLLEEAEFAARRDAEQMAKTIVGLREALARIQAINETGWTQDNFGVELTRALTAIENARMEWNGARMKFDVLTDAPRQEGDPNPAGRKSPGASLLETRDFFQLARLGLAIQWPLALVLLISAAAILAAIWFRR